MSNPKSIIEIPSGQVSKSEPQWPQELSPRLLTLAESLKRTCRSDFGNFLRRCNLDKQKRLAERWHDETLPTLLTVDVSFGRGSASAWLVPRLWDVVEFSGVRDKFSQRQLAAAADVIAKEYSFLTVGDIDRWCMRVKAGRYGKLFYGSADPMSLTASLYEYFTERRHEVANMERPVEADEEGWCPPPADLMERINQARAEAYADRNLQNGRAKGCALPQ